MLKYIQIAIGVIITSFYFFPFEFTFLPGANTKMAMAGIGLVVLGFQLGKARNSLLNKDLMLLSGYALLVSLIGFISVTYNETRDYSYATYIVSMWVWLSAAYVAVMYMRKVHGYVSVELVCNYLIAVCVFQCVSALLIQYVPLFKSLVNEYVGRMSGMGGALRMDERGRLYGIGAALDVAGTRFAGVMFMVAYLLLNTKGGLSKYGRWLYSVSFFIILVVGNMIARTTIVGFAVAILYMVGVLFFKKEPSCKIRNAAPFCVVGSIGLIVVSLLCAKNELFYDNIRFAFEGFFSLYEDGTWNMRSNDILATMYRVPSAIHTWIIGDGYFDNPNIDPFYVGYRWKGFYMGTDVGYLRFIYYFGLSGLCAFCAFMYQSMTSCVRKHSRHKFLFIGLLLINGIVWLKVSTDLFLLFAPFIIIGVGNITKLKI